MDPLRLLSFLVTDRLLPTDVDPAWWPELCALALSHELGPVLYQILENADHLSFPPREMKALKKSARSAAYLELYYEVSVRKIARAMEAAHIPALWLKGAALARTVYSKPCLRPMSDLDLLVPKALREQAITVLKKTGYQFTADILLRPPTLDKSEAPGKADETYLKNLAFHHDVLRAQNGPPLTVELHFALQAYNRGRKLLTDKQMEWFFEHAEIFYSDGHVPCLTLSPEAHLIYLAAHHIIQHGEENATLLGDLDLHLLITHAEVDWEVISRKAVELGWTTGVLRALERAAGFFSTPVPQTVLDRLQGEQTPLEAPWLLNRKHTPGQRWTSTKARIRGLSNREKLRYIYHNFFPSTGYMGGRYSIPAYKPVWPYYPYRWFDQGREILRGAAAYCREWFS
jgi:hypothetical protein